MVAFWYINISVENGPFIVDLPIKVLIFGSNVSLPKGTHDFHPWPAPTPSMSRPNMAATRSADIPEALITLTAWEDKGPLVALGVWKSWRKSSCPMIFEGFHKVLMEFEIGFQ